MSQKFPAQPSYVSSLPLTWSYSYETLLFTKTWPHPAPIQLARRNPWERQNVRDQSVSRMLQRSGKAPRRIPQNTQTKFTPNSWSHKVCDNQPQRRHKKGTRQEMSLEWRSKKVNWHNGSTALFTAANRTEGWGSTWTPKTSMQLFRLNIMSLSP